MIDRRLEKLLEYYVYEIRDTMDFVIDEIDGDFKNWCELGTMLLFRVIKEEYPELSNEAMVGTFNCKGHFWNVIEGIIVDTTIDQFGEYEPGVIDKKYIKNYKVKNKVEFDIYDLEHITEEIYPLLEIL